MDATAAAVLRELSVHLSDHACTATYRPPATDAMQTTAYTQSDRIARRPPRTLPFARALCVNDPCMEVKWSSEIPTVTVMVMVMYACGSIA